MKSRIKLLVVLGLIYLGLFSATYYYFSFSAGQHPSLKIIFLQLFVSISPVQFDYVLGKIQYSNVLGRGSLEIYGTGRLSEGNISLSLVPNVDLQSTTAGMQLEPVKLTIHGAIVDQQVTFDGDQLPTIDLPARLDFTLPSLAFNSPSRNSLSQYWSTNFNTITLEIRIAGKVASRFAFISWVVPFDSSYSVTITGSIQSNSCYVLDHSYPCKQGYFVYRQ